MNKTKNKFFSRFLNLQILTRAFNGVIREKVIRYKELLHKSVTYFENCFKSAFLIFNPILQHNILYYHYVGFLTLYIITYISITISSAL